MKDIKALLKETREAVEKKDFENALKLSKSILREDKTNFMALLFLGFSLQEVGPVEQALKAFQKAIDLNSSNPLGWQGLINYYEKINTEERKPELIKCILSYLDVESNEAKIIKYSNKLIEIKRNEDIYDISKVLWNCSKKCTDENKMKILKQINEVLESDTNNNLKLLDVYQNCMPDLMSSSIITEKLCSNYLSLLYKEKLDVQVLENAIVINKIYPDNVLFLSWICKIYNELSVEEHSQIYNFDSSIEEYTIKLLKLDPENAMGIFTEAVLLFKEQKILEAKDKLIKVTSQRPGLIYAWLLLTNVLVKLENVEGALMSLDKTKKLVQGLNNAVVISKLIVIQEVKALSLSGDSTDWLQALNLYSREDFPKELCLFSIANIYISLEQYPEALKYITQCSNEEEACLLKVRLYKKQKNYSEALNFMKKYSFNSADWWMELGILFWNMEEHQQTLEPFLKAAKCNPNNYQSFFWLGKFYNRYNQTDKARRCFEKAYRINSGSSQAGCELSKIYRKLKNWEANLSLLTSLAKDMINKKNLWAWLQLGLTYFEQGDTSNSIEYLRMVVRFDPENLHCWESLADAYFTRGSFKSALKCYEKALSIFGDSLYSSLQIAYIKKILGEYTEAQADFENILRVNTEYVPALKGLAETALCQAMMLYKDERLKRAWEYGQLAANNLCVAILQRSELSCLWKILGDVIYFIAKLPDKYCCLMVPGEFFGEGTEDEFLERGEVFSFAIKCFCKAVNLTQDNPFLWQDLAVCYLEYARYDQGEDTLQKLLSYAIQAGQKCIELDPSNWQYWNLLGCIHFFNQSPTGVVQHCFIKAIIAEQNSAVSWTNLGTLYLLEGEIKLANKAFGEGQRADPDYVNSWIGQALIAEGIKHGDTMGLFRHSIQLDHQEQGCLGYANCVCEALIKSPPKDKGLQYSLYDMHAIPVACNAIQWYIERHPKHGCAWNLFGILLERMGLKSSAKKAFQNAFRFSEHENRKEARINFGRLLYRTGNLTEAIEMFNDAEEATFSGGSGLALALYKSGYYEESYSAYEQALHWLATEQTNQSDLLVALASMAYKFQGSDAAKTLLFQSIELKPTSPWSLYATLSLALLHNDGKLAKLVCQELSGLEMKLNEFELDQSEFIYHYVTLLSYHYFLRNNKQEAKAELSKLVHKYPNESSTWLTLSTTMFRMDKSKKALKIAAKCAQTAIKLGRTTTDVCKVLYVVALSFYMAGDIKQAFCFAQKAVHTCPSSVEAWSMLILSQLIQRDEKPNDSLIAWFDNLKV